MSRSRKGYCLGDLNPAKRPNVRMKISIAAQNRVVTKRTKKILSEAQIRSQAGRNGNASKGDAVGYRALHNWVERQLGKPRFCEDCGDRNKSHRSYHWANVSGNYKRLITDWRRLCAKCHKTYDRAKAALKLE